MGIPATIAFASIVSGLILQMDGFLGIAGWRWLFLLEGLPAVILGIVCLLYLADRPAEAKWLTTTRNGKSSCVWNATALSNSLPAPNPASSSISAAAMSFLIGRVFRACYVAQRQLHLGSANRARLRSRRELCRHRFAHRASGDPDRRSHAVLGCEL